MFASPRAWWRSVRAFSSADRAAGITLTAATVAALAWATISPSSYHHTWTYVAPFPRLPGLRFSLRDWANQGLMTLFFAVVGLEIRREFSSGELASWRRASVPVAAALGGMAVPAAIYASSSTAAWAPTGGGSPWPPMWPSQ